jgi:hypothetical protein
MNEFHDWYEIPSYSKGTDWFMDIELYLCCQQLITSHISRSVADDLALAGFENFDN